MYKINETEFKNPKLKLISLTDNVLHQTLTTVLIEVNHDSGKFYWNLANFEYSETYEDADVMAWALVELENYISL